MSAIDHIALEQPQPTEQHTGMHPKKMIAWLFTVSITMIFAALSSALIVRKGEGDWLEFGLPNQLAWSTAIIILSSAFMYLAQVNIKKDRSELVKVGMGGTTVLSILFAYFQYLAWTQLQTDGIFFTGPTSNPAGSFVYVMVWAHFFHVLAGIAFLFIVFVRSMTGRINSTKSISLETCAIYWHFLGVLWVYVYMFLYFNH